MKKRNKITLLVVLVLSVVLIKSAIWTHKNPKIWKEIAENKIEFTTQKDIQNLKNMVE
jgi:hypothetical protein